VQSFVVRLRRPSGRRFICRVLYGTWFLAGEFAQEFALVHVVFEGFAAVDEDDRDFVGELTAQKIVGIDVDFLPTEQAAALEFDQTLFDDFAEMAALARVNENFTRGFHVAECSRFRADCNPQKCKEE
jgi:hypothetical protein